jgi:hypothetical protein
MQRLEELKRQTDAKMVQALRSVERMVLEKAEPGLIANHIHAIIRTLEGWAMATKKKPKRKLAAATRKLSLESIQRDAEAKELAARFKAHYEAQEKAQVWTTRAEHELARIRKQHGAGPFRRADGALIVIRSRGKKGSVEPRRHYLVVLGKSAQSVG